jgi:hypothetical protein
VVWEKQLRSRHDNPYAAYMLFAFRTLTVGFSLAAHLLLAGAQLPHCHANHDSAGDHEHAERCHDPHAGHVHVSHSHHRHTHTYSHAPRGRDHHHLSHEFEGTPRECSQFHRGCGLAYCGCCLADHGITVAIPPRVERGTDSGIDLSMTAAMPLAATPLSQAAVDVRQALGLASHAASRLPSLHDLLPHVLRL